MNRITNIESKRKPSPEELAAAIEHFSGPDLPPTEDSTPDSQPNFMRRRAVAAVLAAAIVVPGVIKGPDIADSVVKSLGANPAELQRKEAETDAQVREIFRTGEQVQSGTEPTEFKMSEQIRSTEGRPNVYVDRTDPNIELHP